MGAVTDALAAAARRGRRRSWSPTPTVTSVEADGVRGSVTWTRWRRRAVSRLLLRPRERRTGDAGCSRVVVRSGVRPEGSQLKINLLLRRLPLLKSGDDPARAFAGTFHIDEDYSQLESAYSEAAAGELPAVPARQRSTATRSPIRRSSSPALVASGHHTLTVFGVHFPARLFADDNDAARDLATRRVLAGLESYLAEPLEDCIARDADGNLCVEAKTPYDIEESVGMPGGHIFHGDLQWPWATDDAERRPLGHRDRRRQPPDLRLRSPPRRRRLRPRRPQRRHDHPDRLTDFASPPTPCYDPHRSKAPQAPLAQLAEQLTLNQRVRGSSPWRRTKSPGHSVGLGFFMSPTDHLRTTLADTRVSVRPWRSRPAPPWSSPSSNRSTVPTSICS